MSDVKVESAKEYRPFRVPDMGLRAAGQSKLPDIEGHAAVFNSKSEDLGGFREIIVPGAFARTIEEGADVRALVDHDPSKIIGRTAAGTLALKEDDKGLRVSINPADTTAGRDVVESIRRRDVDSMSFGFIVREGGDEWITEENGDLVRMVKDVDLFDVSPVSFPAYKATDVKVAKRSLEQWQTRRADDDRKAKAKAIKEKEARRQWLKQQSE